MRAKIEERLDTVRKEEDKGHNRFVDLQKKMFPEPQTHSTSGHYGKKISFDDVTNLFR